MNLLNHLLTPFNILFLLFHNTFNLSTIALFCLVFGVLIDADEGIGALLKKPPHHHRTWVQEPFGILLIGLPIGIILSVLFNPLYIFLTLIPFTTHVILDYLTFHEVTPLAPFSKKNFKVGFFKPWPVPNRDKNKKGLSENYLLLINLVIVAILII